MNFLILDFILFGSKFPLFLFAPNLILSYPCTFTSWNIIEIAALKSLMIPKAGIILGLTLFFAWRTGYIFLGLSGREEYQVMWDVSWTFCVRCVLLHNPVSNRHCPWLRLQLVSCLQWVSVQFSLTLSCMCRPELRLRPSVLLEPLLHSLASA